VLVRIKKKNNHYRYKPRVYSKILLRHIIYSEIYIIYTRNISYILLPLQKTTVHLKGERHEKQIHKNAFVFVGQRVYFYLTGVILKYIVIANTFFIYISTEIISLLFILYFSGCLVFDIPHKINE